MIVETIDYSFTIIMSAMFLVLLFFPIRSLIRNEKQKFRTDICLRNKKLHKRFLYLSMIVINASFYIHFNSAAILPPSLSRVSLIIEATVLISAILLFSISIFFAVRYFDTKKESK